MLVESLDEGDWVVGVTVALAEFEFVLEAVLDVEIGVGSGGENASK